MYLFVIGFLWCSVCGTYPLNSYISKEFEGRIYWWSKFEAGTTASDYCFLDLLLLTAFRPRGLLYRVMSICSIEEPHSFHAKRKLVVLATSFLRSGGIQSLFAFLPIHISVYFGLFSSLFFITESIHFISAYALCPATLCDLRKLEKKKRKCFSHAYALFHCALVWSQKIWNIEKNI